MKNRNASMDWVERPRVALGLAAMTAAVALIAFFVMVVQENVHRAAERKRQQALGVWSQSGDVSARSVLQKRPTAYEQLAQR